MKCINCTADIPDGNIKCDYCGTTQQQLDPNNQNNYDQNNYNQNNYNPNVQNSNIQYVPVYINGNNNGEKSNMIRIMLFVSIVICGIACFLPYFSILGISQNYVYGNDRLYDGIFIIAFGVVSIISLLFKKHKPVLIFQLLSAGVFFYDYIHQKQSEYSEIISRLYGVGFYLLFIFLIVSVVLSIIRIVKKDKYL